MRIIDRLIERIDIVIGNIKLNRKEVTLTPRTTPKRLGDWDYRRI